MPAVTVAGAGALANWGVAPTFGTRAWSQPILEIHFVDGVVPELGASLEVVFNRFLRPERKFPDLASLQAAIAADVVESKSVGVI